MSLAGIKSGCQQAEFLSGGTVEQPVSLLIWVLLANFSSSWLCDCDLHCLANWQLRAISRFQKLPYSLSHDTFPLSSKPATIRQAPLMFCISVPFSLLASVLSILLSSFPFLRIHVIIMVPPWHSRIINPPILRPFILKLYGKSSFCQIRCHTKNSGDYLRDHYSVYHTLKLLCVIQKFTCNLVCVCMCSVTQLCPTLCNFMVAPLPMGFFQARILSHLLIQGIFLTQGSNPRLLYLLHWQVFLYHCATCDILCHKDVDLQPCTIINKH